MIFSFTGEDKGLDSIFHNRSLDLMEWTSVIPSPVMDKSLFGDPALIQDFYGDSSKISYIGSLYLYNQITSSRIVIGKIASTLGFLQPEFENISNIFKEEADAISIAISTAAAIIDSEYFAKGLDAIGAIPVVGWIIKIIVKAAELVYKIVQAINQKKIKNVREELSGQFSIPLTEFSEEADQELSRVAMLKIKNNDMNYIFSPRYIFEGLEDFETVSEKIKPTDQLTKYFNVRSKNQGGLGFIPGTTSLTGALRFPTKGAMGLYDTGDLYPTVRSLGSAVNQIVQKPGPCLFGLDPEVLSSQWEVNIYNLLVYAEESIKKGWSIHETGYPDTNEWLCAEPLLGSYGSKACKKAGNVGKKYKTFGNGHYGAFRLYLMKRYFGDKFPHKGNTYNPDDIKIEESIPVKALKNIHETQKAVIQSDICMYVNLEVKKGKPMFSGLYHDSFLKEKWYENVKLVMNSDEWKRIRFLDVPDGEVKNALYDKATSKGIDPEKTGPISKSINTLGVPSVLKNPKPPSPFEPIEFEMKSERKGRPDVKKSSADSSSAFLALGALGAMGLYLKNR